MERDEKPDTGTQSAPPEAASPEDRRARVVIVGGGFGGIQAARALAREPVRVTLLDRYNYHLFRPMLYQAATGLLSENEITAPIRGILRDQKNASVVMAEVTGVDTANRRVLLGEQSISYDYLVLATGVQYNYFGHDEWAKVALSLSTVEDAVRIRGRILEAFEAAEQAASAQANGNENLNPNEPLIQQHLTFVLVGAGPTGVEMAGAIAELRNAMEDDFRCIHLSAVRIVLCETGPRILAQFPADLAEKSRRHLEVLGVEVLTGTSVESVDAEGVVVAGERIPSRTVLWCAGVKGSPAGKWLGAATDKQERVQVNADLSVPGHAEIFVIGDTASLSAPTRNLLGTRDPTPRPVPALAQPAIQQGRYVGKVIHSRVWGEPAPEPFTYRDKGNMAIVGGFFAIADIKIARWSGFPAWLLWLTIHIAYLVTFANRLLVMAQWGISFLTNRRQARILSAPAPSHPSEAAPQLAPARAPVAAAPAPDGGVPEQRPVPPALLPAPDSAAILPPPGPTAGVASGARFRPPLEPWYRPHDEQGSDTGSEDDEEDHEQAAPAGTSFSRGPT